MSVAYIGIGSNLGNKRYHCLKAVELLKQNGLRVSKMSSLYETEPWGVREQPSFMNMAVEVETDLAPRKLLDLLKRIERRMGRKKTQRWGPRSIDLDILLYDDLVIREEDLIVPHPLMHERTFVLVPLSEIAHDKVHPVFLTKVGDILRKRNGDRSARKLD